MGIVTQLGYASSLVATSMRRSRTHVIGVLVAEFEPFALQLLHGVSDALSGTSYDVLAYAGAVSTGSHHGWEARSLSRLGGTLIDGAVVVTPTVEPPEVGMPIVSIDPHAGPAGPAVVDTDNLRGGREATAHLITLGHRRIGYLRGRDDLESARLREEGYREALASAGLDIDAVPHRHGRVPAGRSGRGNVGAARPRGSADGDLRVERRLRDRGDPRRDRARAARAPGSLRRRIRRHPCGGVGDPAAHDRAPAARRHGSRRGGSARAHDRGRCRTRPRAHAVRADREGLDGRTAHLRRAVRAGQPFFAAIASATQRALSLTVRSPVA